VAERLCSLQVAVLVGCSDSGAGRWADLLGVMPGFSGYGGQRWWTEEQVRALRVALVLQGGAEAKGGGETQRRSRTRLARAARAAGDRPGSFLCFRVGSEPEFYPDARSAALAATQGGVCQILRVPD